MPQSRYPEAIWRGDGDSGGSFVGYPWRVVLHTTETRTIPGYQSGATAPHLTYFPAANYWVQHSSFAVAARALKNISGGVQTNRGNALQVEIVCYSNKGIAQQVGGKWVGDLTETHLRSIARFLRWTSTEFGVNLSWPGRQAYSYAEANAPGFRLSFAQWQAYRGILAHQHVPENEHWDTGALDWIELMSYTGGMDQLTPDEVAELRALLASLKAAGSSVYAMGPMVKVIKLLRKIDDIFDAEEV